MGLFRKQPEGVGQKPRPAGALGDNPAPDARLGDHMSLVDAAYLPFLDKSSLSEGFITTCSYGPAEFQLRDRADSYFRCVSQVRYIYERTTWPPAAFYIEHPKTKLLMPIVKAAGDRRFNGQTVVWFTHRAEDSFVVPCSTPMYVSDEKGITGKTFDELGL